MSARRRSDTAEFALLEPPTTIARRSTSPAAFAACRSFDPSPRAEASAIEALITHADRAIPLEAGRVRLSVSRETVAALQARGRLGPTARRLADLSVVWDPALGQVVEVRAATLERAAA